MSVTIASCWLVSTAFHDAAHIELPGEPGDGFDNGRAVGLLGQILHKAAVDFDRVEWKAAQIAKRRERSAEIIERDTHTAVAKPMQRFHGVRIVTQQHALGDFQFEPLWLQDRRG